MAKFAIVFCMLLAASMAYDDEKWEYDERMATKLKNMCAGHLNHLFTTVLATYEKIMASSPDKESTDLAESLYQLAGKTLYALRKEVMNQDYRKPLESSSMECSDNIAYKAYDVFYRSWNGLEELAATLGLQ